MKFFLVFALSLLLAACQSTKLDVALQKNLPAICRGADNVHTVFIAATFTGKIKESTIRKEAAGYAALQAFCNDPSSITSQTAVAAAAQAYATYLIAVRSK